MTNVRVNHNTAHHLPSLNFPALSFLMSALFLTTTTRLPAFGQVSKTSQTEVRLEPLAISAPCSFLNLSTTNGCRRHVWPRAMRAIRTTSGTGSRSARMGILWS